MEREERKTAKAPKVGGTCTRALSQEGDGEFEELEKIKTTVGLMGHAEDFKSDL